jgi:hypothetical protein
MIPSMPDRDDAQRRANQIRAFRAELDALESDGVAGLTPERRQAVDAYHDRLLAQFATEYDVDPSEEAGQLSRGMQLASFFAALALTAAVYSLVSRFWGGLDLPLQASLLAAFPLIALVGVEFSARRERTLYIASLFAMVAYGTFWLAAGVLSWTLNIPMTPMVVWAGALFGLALSLAYGFRVILAISLFAVTIAVPASVFAASGIPWNELATNPELQMLTAFAVTLLTPRLARIHGSFAPAARLVGFGVGLGAMLLLTVAGEMSLLPMSSRTAEGAYQVVMLVTSVAVLVVAVRNHWRETVNLSAILLTAFLLTRFTDWFWEVLPRYVFFLMLATLAFGWLLAMRRIRARLAQGRR